MKKYNLQYVGKVYTSEVGNHTLKVIDGGSAPETVVTQFDFEPLKEVNKGVVRTFKKLFTQKSFGGYIGFGTYYNIKKNHMYTYTMWHHMFRRCYDIELQSRTHGTYSNVTVCEDWRNFQNFAKWVELHYPKNATPNEYHLEKDLINTDAKEYSPKNCIFVCQELNKFITNIKKTNTSGCTGVHWDRSNCKWVTQIQINGKRKRVYIGNSKEEACNTYKQLRVEYTKQLQAYYSFDYPKHILDNIR